MPTTSPWSLKRGLLIVSNQTLRPSLSANDYSSCNGCRDCKVSRSCSESRCATSAGKNSKAVLPQTLLASMPKKRHQAGLTPWKCPSLSLSQAMSGIMSQNGPSPMLALVQGFFGLFRSVMSIGSLTNRMNRTCRICRPVRHDPDFFAHVELAT